MLDFMSLLTSAPISHPGDDMTQGQGDDQSTSQITSVPLKIRGFVVSNTSGIAVPGVPISLMAMRREAGKGYCDNLVSVSFSDRCGYFRFDIPAFSLCRVKRLWLKCPSNLNSGQIIAERQLSGGFTSVMSPLIKDISNWTKKYNINALRMTLAVLETYSKSISASSINDTTSWLESRMTSENMAGIFEEFAVEPFVAQFFVEAYGNELKGLKPPCDIENMSSFARAYLQYVVRCHAEKFLFGFWDRHPLPYLQIEDVTSPSLASKIFEVKVDDDVTRVKGSFSIQRPDLIDWQISPGSFGSYAVAALESENTIDILPSNDAVREYLFHEFTDLKQVASIDTLDKPTDLQPQGSELAAAIDLQQAPKVGKDILIADVKEYKQAWIPLGHALGDIIYSLALAPGESTNIAVIDWSRDESASRVEGMEYGESLDHIQMHDRTIAEIVSATVIETQSGHSMMSGASSGTGSSGSGSGNVQSLLTLSGTALTGITNGIAGAYTDSKGIRNLTGTTVQNIADQIVQNSSVKRQMRSTVIVQANQKEQETLQTRTITNPNRGHALTVQYYEVLRHFRVETTYTGLRRVLLIPFKLIDFSNGSRSLVLKYVNLLKRALLDRNLEPCFDALYVDLFKQPKPDHPKQPSAGEQLVTTISIIVMGAGKAGANGAAAIPVPKSAIHVYLCYGDHKELELAFDTFSIGYLSASQPSKGEARISQELKRSDIHTVKIESKPAEPAWTLTSLKLWSGPNEQEGDILYNKSVTWDFNANAPVWGPEDVNAPTKPEEPVTPETPTPKQPVLDEQQAQRLIQLLLEHLQANQVYYSRVIWLGQDADERAMQLGPLLHDTHSF